MLNVLQAPLPLSPGAKAMTQVYDPHPRRQIFKDLGIKLCSPPSILMGNAMPVPASISCTTARLTLHPPSLSPRSSANLAVPAQPTYDTYGCALSYL